MTSAMPGVSIRQMLIDDMPAVLEVQSVCYVAIVPESAQSMSAKLLSAPATCFVAEQEDRMVGYLISLPWIAGVPPMLNAPDCVLPLEPDCLYLHDLAVIPSARKSGAGSALISAGMDCVQKLGLPQACLIAIQDSAAYWARHGFRLHPPSETLRAKLDTYGSDAIYMTQIVKS